MGANFGNISKNARMLLMAAGVTSAGFTGAHLDKKVNHEVNKCNCKIVGSMVVKTLQDEGVGKVDFGSKEATGVANLIQLQKEKIADTINYPDDVRTPNEERVFTVRCIIYNADEDTCGNIRLSLRDPQYPGSTMVAEIANPQCTNQNNKTIVSKLRKVKGDWRTRYNDKRIWSRDTFEIKGVVYFEKGNHTIGSNANGVELYPVLSIKKI
jgi:hypothetical protein